jgi:hypothetical protein
LTYAQGVYVKLFLDLEIREDSLEQKDQMQKAIAMASPEQLGHILEILQKIGIGNIVQANNG